jgi:PhnB protein
MISHLSPHIVVRDAAAAATWYANALGATEHDRIPVPGDKYMQIELHFGSTVVMLCDEFPQMNIISPLTLGGTHGALHVTTDDAAALFERAVAAGAEILQPLGERFWGELYGQIRDPFGHRWNLAQKRRDVPADEIAKTAWAMFGGTPT